MAAELVAHRGDHTQDVVGAAARSLPGVKRRRGGRRGDAEFQRRFDVSRTVAREVAKSLETAKVVTVHRRIGLVSQPVEEWDALSTQVIHWKLHSTHRKEQLRTLTELRLAIEPAAATSAARYAPIDVKSRLPLLAAELRHTGEDGRLFWWMLNSTALGMPLTNDARLWRSDTFRCRMVSSPGSQTMTSSRRVISVGTPANRKSCSSRSATARLISLSTVPLAATAPPSCPPWPGSMTTV